MAWGIFKKIGQGLKKGFNWVKDKVIKPIEKVISPVAKAVAPVVGSFIPGAEKVINTGVDLVDRLAGNSVPNNIVGMNGHGIQSRRIRMK